MTKEFRDLFTAIGKISLILNRQQKRTYVLSFFFMMVSSVLELFALGALVPFFGIIASPSLLQHSSWGNWVLTHTHNASFAVVILVSGMIIFFLFVGKNIVGYLLYAHESRFVYSVATDISRRKVREYYSMNFLDFQKSNTAEMLQKTAYVPIEFAHHVVLGSMTLLSEATILIVFIFALLLYRAVVFLLIACTLLPLAVVAWYLSARVLRRTKKTVQEMSSLNLNRLADALSGYQEIRLYGKEEYFVERYVSGQRDLNIQLGKLNTANIIPGRLSEIFAVAGILLLLFFDSILEGSFTPSALSLLTVYVAFAYRAVPSINKILSALVHLNTYSFTVDVIPAATVGEEPASHSGIRAEKTPFRFHKDIEFRKISFFYPERNELVLNNVSFILHKGETIGLVGRSGLGKTTFVRIFMQLLKQTSGTILVDGKILGEEDLLPWQRLFSYVTQEPVILADSIEANVTYGIPRQNGDKERLNGALQRSGLSEFVAGLPDGVRTHVGDQGKQLSGGQKQRLMIARALYRNAEIIVFDEATSQLDTETEQDFLETISLLQGDGKTILIISQKEQTLTMCSAVYTLAHGTIRLRPGIKTNRRR